MALVPGLGIGVGLLILIIVWVVAVAIMVILVFIPKARYGIPLVLVLLVVVNLFIFLFPRSNQQTSASREDVDSLFIVRIFLLLFVTASIIASFVLVGVFHWAEPIRARALHNKQQQQ